MNVRNSMPYGRSIRYAVRRATKGIQVHFPGSSGRTIRLPVTIALEFLEKLWPELQREAKLGALKFAGGSFSVKRRKASTIQSIAHDHKVDVPASRRLIWKGPKF